MVEESAPVLSITRIDPADALPQVPSGEGKLPTSTKPSRRIFNAVVRPRGAVPWKKIETGVAWGDGGMAGTSIMVVPEPWRLLAALKFETRISPGLSGPPDGNPGGTKATPYGF